MGVKQHEQVAIYVVYSQTQLTAFARYTVLILAVIYVTEYKLADCECCKIARVAESNGAIRCIKTVIQYFWRLNHFIINLVSIILSEMKELFYPGKLLRASPSE